VLGLVVLFGTAVNGAIVLYETSRDLADRGAKAAVAAYAGAARRVRPVLVTTITTVVALVPVVVSPGGAAQRSMSAAMVGGMLASTGLTLFVAPILFVRFLKAAKGEERAR
jgi:multidrug efflux pump subunit AcrB